MGTLEYMMKSYSVQRHSNVTSPPLKKEKQVDLRQSKNNVSATLQPSLFITEEIWKQTNNNKKPIIGSYAF